VPAPALTLLPRDAAGVEMKTATALLLSLLVLSLPDSSASPPAQVGDIRVFPVSGPIYMLVGKGGNIAASVGDDGIILVDDQLASQADGIREALAGLRDGPVRYIINTHHHIDHTGGNGSFAVEDGASILSHHNARTRMVHQGRPPQALPVLTFDDDLSLYLNGELVRVVHAPHAHTDGDSIIYFTASNVLHTGDTFVTYGFPFIDTDAGGSLDGMIAAAEFLIGVLPEDVLIIPGHGRLSTLDDLRAFLQLLRETREAVAGGIAAGLSCAQLKRQHVLRPWQHHQSRWVSADDYLDAVCADLSADDDASARQHR
jgi:cyclase